MWHCSSNTDAKTSALRHSYAFVLKEYSGSLTLLFLLAL